VGLDCSRSGWRRSHQTNGWLKLGVTLCSAFSETGHCAYNEVTVLGWGSERSELRGKEVRATAHQLVE
jgi:hypothetical protein